MSTSLLSTKVHTVGRYGGAWKQTEIGVVYPLQDSTVNTARFGLAMTEYLSKNVDLKMLLPVTGLYVVNRL